MNAVWVITSQYCGLFSTLDECGWMSLEFTHWWPSDSYRGHKKYFYLHITVQDIYFTCIRFTTFFCTQTAKKPEDLRRYSSQFGLSEHDGVSLSSAQRHRYSLFFSDAFCFVLIIHARPVCLYRPLLELFCRPQPS